MPHKRKRTNPHMRSDAHQSSSTGGNSGAAYHPSTTSVNLASGRSHQSQAQGGFVAAYIPEEKRRADSAALSGAALSGVGYSNAGQYSRMNPDYMKYKRNKNRGKKIALGVLVAVLVVLVGAGTALALYINSVNQRLMVGNKSQEELEAIDAALTGTAQTFDQPFYTMLIGSDARAEDIEMGARADTNVLVRIDPTKNIITMVSIPRDTMIELAGYGTVKFNASYTYGQAAGAIRAANELTGAAIDHYAEVNFEGLVSLVDAIGGVEVEVDEAINDPDAGWMTIDAGQQHLNGTAALVFARSRAYTDGDYSRAYNQRKLIEAIAAKVLSLPPTDLPGTIQAAATCVTTDLSLTDIIALAQQMKENGELTVYSVTIPSTTTTIGGISYVVADKAAITDLMRVVDSGQDPSAYGMSSVLDPNQREGYVASEDLTADLNDSSGIYDDGSSYYDYGQNNYGYNDYGNTGGYNNYGYGGGYDYGYSENTGTYNNGGYDTNGNENTGAGGGANLGGGGAGGGEAYDSGGAGGGGDGSDMGDTGP